MRVAVFVDAGYLYGAGIVAILGTGQKRASVRLIQDKALEKLKGTARERASDCSLLRIYWYDGATAGRRSPEHVSLAMAEDVKLRLGTVTGGRQKGVDSLIVTDLVELARNHSISDAVLMSGDEDLRIGVQIAQSLGVRVHLIGIEPSRSNQSNALQEEADTLTEWVRKDLEEILSVRRESGVEAEAIPPVDTTNADENEGLESIFTTVAEEVISSIGKENLAKVATDLAQSKWAIPYAFDRVLLGRCKELAGRDLEAEEKRQLRAKFREVFEEKSS